MPWLRTFSIWAAQFRAPFLILPVVLVMIAGAAAGHEGRFHALHWFLTLLGMVLAHSAVNLFNEVSDFRSGIDAHTRRTPFSGGSGNLPQGLTSLAAVRRAAWITLLAALGLGLYLTWVSGWLLLGFIAVGGLTIVSYTPVLSRWGVGEFAAGLGLGTLVVLGTYYVQTTSLSWAVFWLSLPPGILTSLLLFLNEFPDADADRQGGRWHLVIRLGYPAAARLYTAAMILMYGLLVLGVVLRIFPGTVLLALLTLPLGWHASRTVLAHGQNHEKMLSALAANVAMVLGTDALIALAYWIA